MLQRLCWVLLFWCLSIMFVFAASSPVSMLEDAANEVIAELASHKATLKTNRAVVYQIIDKVVLPHVDVKIMSASVVKKDVWKSASPADQERFTKAFTKVVVKTYAGALAEYNNQTVQFSPISGDLSSQKIIKVNSRVSRPGAPPLSMTYKLVQRSSGWMVYDINVEGVSLLQSFRSQFADYLKKDDFQALISELEKRNQQ